MCMNRYPCLNPHVHKCLPEQIPLPNYLVQIEYLVVIITLV